MGPRLHDFSTALPFCHLDYWEHVKDHIEGSRHAYEV